MGACVFYSAVALKLQILSVSKAVTQGFGPKRDLQNNPWTARCSNATRKHKQSRTMLTVSKDYLHHLWLLFHSTERCFMRNGKNTKWLTRNLQRAKESWGSWHWTGHNKILRMSGICFRTWARIWIWYERISVYFSVLIFKKTQTFISHHVTLLYAVVLLLSVTIGVFLWLHCSVHEEIWGPSCI